MKQWTKCPTTDAEARVAFEPDPKDDKEERARLLVAWNKYLTCRGSGMTPLESVHHAMMES